VVVWWGSGVSASQNVFTLHCGPSACMGAARVPQSPLPTSSSQVPKKLLLWLINWLVPDVLKTELVKLLPLEIGHMLLQSRLSTALDLTVRVLPADATLLECGVHFMHVATCNHTCLSAAARYSAAAARAWLPLVAIECLCVHMICACVCGVCVRPAVSSPQPAPAGPGCGSGSGRGPGAAAPSVRPRWRLTPVPQAGAHAGVALGTRQ
jgi:hypothetical protein